MEVCQWCEQPNAVQIEDTVYWELPDGTKAIEIREVPSFHCGHCGARYQSDETVKEIERQSAYLSRKEIIDISLDNYGAIIVCDDMDKACEIANEIAPEHLEVLVKNPLEYIGRLTNCGSLFLGDYAPEPLGDYYAGPNHVLPTSGTARFFSPLSVDSFIKKSSYIYYTREKLFNAKDDIVLVAEREQLTAHANAIKVRFED